MKYIIAYPPVDFSVPFPELKPEQIDIYFHYTNEIGGRTCKAACAHCYFRSKPTFHIPPDKALDITESLRAQGFNIGMAPADSFADEALMAGNSGSAFRLKAIGNSAWSSGMPLALPNWEARLDRAWQIGFRSIIITAHEAAGTMVPIKGITKAPVIRQAFKNIIAWNNVNNPKRFSTATTFTIRPDNCNLDLMRQMISWGVEEGLDLVRFNCFANFQSLPEHRQFEMSREKIVEFYDHLARLQVEFQDAPTSLGISEDWGDAGIEQIYPYLPPEWQSRKAGWCRAGYRLFAMIEVNGEIVLTGCVDKWEPVMGKLIQIAPIEYRIVWKYDQIETLRQAILDDKVYACWGGVGYGRPTEASFGTDSIAEDEIMRG